MNDKQNQKDRQNQDWRSVLVQNFGEQTPQTPKPVLHSEEVYDTQQPEEVLKTFCASVRLMLSTYEYDKAMLIELESEMQDLLHYAEMSTDKNAREGYRIYKKLSEVRRQRRACKNEIDLLAPVYEMFHGTDMLNKLGYVQGQCRKLKDTIDKKGYVVRTDVLSDFVAKKKEETSQESEP